MESKTAFTSEVVIYALKIAFMILLGTAIILIPLHIMDAIVGELGDSKMLIPAGVALPVCVILAGLIQWKLGHVLGVFERLNSCCK